MVSKTLITPGCRNVLDLRTAFFARGRRDLFAWISNAKTLQIDPSSYCLRNISHSSSLIGRDQKPPYPFRTVVQSPNRVTNVDSIAQGERKSTTLRDGGPDSGFEEIHVDEADVAVADCYFAEYASRGGQWLVLYDGDLVKMSCHRGQHQGRAMF